MGILRCGFPEDSTQNFLPSLSRWIRLQRISSIFFRFRKTDDGWKIYRHVNYNDRLYWTVTGDHRQYMNGEVSQETVLANISEGIEGREKALLEQNIQRRDQAGADKEETAVKISYDRQAAVEYAQTWALDRKWRMGRLFDEWRKIARTLYPSVCLPEESRWIPRRICLEMVRRYMNNLPNMRDAFLPGPVSTNF